MLESTLVWSPALVPAQTRAFVVLVPAVLLMVPVVLLVVLVGHVRKTHRGRHVTREARAGAQKRDPRAGGNREICALGSSSTTYVVGRGEGVGVDSEPEPSYPA